MSNYKTSLFIIVLIFVNLVSGIYSKKSLNKSTVLSSKTKSSKTEKNYSKESSKNLSHKTQKKSLIKKLGLKTERGFGFTGTCSNSLSNVLNNVLPDNTAKIFSEIVLPLTSSILALPQICLGDFTGEKISTDSQFDNAECSKIPLNAQSTYGVVSFAAFNVPCNDPVTIGACLIFDDEGTGAIAFNGDLMGCGVALTGIGKIFQPFLKFIGAMGFGVSLNKKFEKTFTVCYNNNGSISCGEKTSKGHFLFVLNLALPNFKVGSKNLKDYLQLNATITYMIDLGNSSSLSSLASSLFTSSNTCEQQSSLISTIRNLGAEYTMTLEGFLTIQLASHTNGFLPDLDLELFETVLLVTTGSGSSGLGTGIYINLKSNVIESIYDVFSSLMDRFLSLFGVSMPSVNLGSLDANMGLFIDTTMFGLQITFPGITLECYFKFDSGKGSCKLNASFFTAILEAAKWVIKKATKFFDETGSTIAEFGSNTIDFAKDASNAVANYTTKQYKLVAREATKVANTVANAGETAAKETLSALISTGSLITNSFNEIKNQTTAYLSNAVSDLVGFTESTWNEIEDVAGEAANFASSVAGSIASGADTVADGLESVSNTIIKSFSSW